MSGIDPKSCTVNRESRASHATKEVTFRVFTDRESGLICASGVDHAIHTHAGSWDLLMRYIREAVECHFEVPFEQVKVNFIESTDVEAQESTDVGDSCD